MKKLFLSSAFVFILSLTYAQDSTFQKKYEYVFLLQKHWETPRTLEILYPDGHTEKFATLAGNDTGENLNKNLATLLKAFNHLGSKGFQLMDQGSANDMKTYIRWQYVFKREL